LDDIEARIRRLEDIEAIRNLAVRYALAVDDRDYDALRSMFTEDSCLRTRTGPVKGQGREGVSAFLHDSLSGRGPTNHAVHGHQISVDIGQPETATGVVLCHAESMRPEGQMIIAMRYYDTYRRVDGAWQFHERVQSFLYLAEAKDYPGILSADQPVRPSKEHARSADWPPRSPGQP
jgi:ketosteroid isomerase-like protein